MELELRNEYETELETLRNEYEAELETLRDEHEKLQNEHDQLQNEHDQLKNEHNLLQNEYNENIIIESMNEMKERYERMMRIMVPSHKYEILLNKYKDLIKKVSGCCVLLDHSQTLLKSVDAVFFTEKKVVVDKIHLELDIIKDILGLINE